MKKKLLMISVAAVMIFTMLAFTGCGSDDSEDTASKDTIVIGLDDTFAPMGFRDEDGNLVGFDIDLANAVAKELGMKAEFKPIDWDA